MKKRLELIALCLPAALSACADKSPDHQVSRSIPSDYVEGSFVVTASDEGSEEGVKTLSTEVAAELGCQAKAPERINWGESSLEASGVLSKDMKNTFNLSFENCDFSRDGTSAIVARLAKGQNVLAVEAEAIAAASPIYENDPNKSAQEHLKFIRRDKACEAADRQGAPIIVAVVDSGVDTDHPDLKDVFLRDAQGEIIGANFVRAGSSMAPDRNFDDGNGHGTHVAGLIGATSNNGRGVVGVGSCANVKIMPIRVLNDEGTGSSIEIERGVKWAADHGAQIINMSLAFTSNMYGNSFRRSIYADLASKDVLVLAAAGNDGYVNGNDPEDDGSKRYHFPSSYDDVISVAATTNSGNLASFSNRGERVDIAAPGYNVLATIRGGGYGRMSGTSMATPVAAGAYALALASARAGLESNVDRIDIQVAEEMLRKATLSTASLPLSQVKSGGVIDVEKLVKAMVARHPKLVDEPSQPEEPSEPSEPAEPAQPAEPSQPILQPAAPFSFVGLKDGQRPGMPQELKVENLPKGTARVSFYWGTSPWTFAKTYVHSPSQTTLTDEDEWYLYGSRTLTAIAYNAYGRVLAKAKVSLKGY